MACYHPIHAHQAKPGAQPTFPKSGPYNIKLPCNRCIGCRLDRSKQWAIRLMHEAQFHERNSFLTLTYADDYLPSRRTSWEPPVPLPLPKEQAPRTESSPHAYETHARAESLSKRDAQLFMKRLRDRLTNKDGSARVKYYLVGEYGDTNGRPHYHAALFGEDFTDDRYQWRTSGQNVLYRSSLLEKAWPWGQAEIGDLTFESAAYVARYIMKKVNGAQADQHYQRTAPDGSNYWLTPEFALMSRGGRTGHGIGRRWIEKYATDVYPHDYVVMRGKKLKPPRYYDKLLEKVDEIGAALIKLERQEKAKNSADDNTPKRLAAKEAVAKARAKQQSRPLE